MRDITKCTTLTEIDARETRRDPKLRRKRLESRKPRGEIAT